MLVEIKGMIVKVAKVEWMFDIKQYRITERAKDIAERNNVTLEEVWDWMNTNLWSAKYNYYDTGIKWGTE